jgi:hypothetical protein
LHVIIIENDDGKKGEKGVVGIVLPRAAHLARALIILVVAAMLWKKIFNKKNSYIKKLTLPVVVVVIQWA